MRKLTNQQIANAFARKNGKGHASHIVYGDCDHPVIVDIWASGFRKYTTGEYVSLAYKDKAWSSCYYQRSICCVMLPVGMCDDDRSNTIYESPDGQTYIVTWNKESKSVIKEPVAFEKCSPKLLAINK